MDNILIVAAHADDAELMAGGSMIKWIQEDKKIVVVTFTDGALTLPDGKVYRSKEEASMEEKLLSNFIGYKSENIGHKNHYLTFSDDNVLALLDIIEKYKIDTLVCPNSHDVVHDHEVASRIAIAASRRIQNVLMGQINYFLDSFFTPNVFVDISHTWEKKIEALKLYKSQWRPDWFEFLDATSIYYGKMIGVKRAEGFVSNKIVLK